MAFSRSIEAHFHSLEEPLDALDRTCRTLALMALNGAGITNTTESSSFSIILTIPTAFRIRPSIKDLFPVSTYSMQPPLRDFLGI